MIQALVGWLIIMGMVFGGVGILFFVMAAIRLLILAIRSHRSGPAR